MALIMMELPHRLLTPHKYIFRLNIPYISLPNILVGKKIIPEFIQENASPKLIVKEILKQLSTSQRKWNYHQFLLAKKKLLKENDPFKKAAELIYKGR